MNKELTIEEWVFALALYPKFNAMDRYQLFMELVANEKIKLQANTMDTYRYKKQPQLKRLSPNKQAAFACFLGELDIRKEMERYRALNISWVYLFADDYPVLLREIYCPPLVLFYQGDYSILSDYIGLGVVGARLASAYGLAVVNQLIPELIEQSKGNIAVISGLAKGIDRAAHEATLRANGRTVGVIGAGLDCYYPRENSRLQERMQREELVLSEYPLGVQPLKFRFPERNRIIAGLSRGILVIEAKQRSGSLITAYNGFDENRDIFACPGSLLTKNSAGCHKLIQEGALLTTRSSDILEEWYLI